MTHPLPFDHADRIARARTALDGLSVGDAMCGQFFVPANRKLHWLRGRVAPPGPWRYTDDTEMALAVFDTLDRHRRVDQDALARAFATRYANEMYRGYGAMAHTILSAIGQGRPWHKVSQAVFDGSGSMGNGAAMRVAPVGAYFADDLGRVAAEAAASAEVTHAHPEGVAGGVAAAVATAVAGRRPTGEELFAAVLDLTPPGRVRDGIGRAAAVPPDTPVPKAAEKLGNGSRITAPDTLPFCVWAAARHLTDYPAALWAVVEAGGDIDTNGAIVGGIVVMAAGGDAVPAEWLREREELQFGVG